MSALLLFAAALDALAALAHVGCIVFGAAWYRFFGAGERMAQMAGRGEWRPTLITSGIVVLLGLWSAYALSAAGAIAPLPLLGPALIAITAVFALRAVVGFALALFRRVPNPRFWWWSSAICLVYAIAHGVGLAQRWPLQ